MYSYYDKILLTRDFNAEVHDDYLESFLYPHELKSLVKEKTCFKSISNPSCIDLFLINNALSSQSTKTVSTGLPDFHKLGLTVLKTSIVKIKPREIQYRNYKYFDSKKFNRNLKDEFSREYVDSCSKFDEIFLKVLNRHGPLKKKMLIANHAPYVSKALRKAIMKSSRLENIYFKKQDNHSLRAYKKQNNYCSRLYKKETTINLKFASFKILFWKTEKPLFSGKGSYNAYIKHTDKDEIIQNDEKVAETIK